MSSQASSCLMPVACCAQAPPRGQACAQNDDECTKGGTKLLVKGDQETNENEDCENSSGITSHKRSRHDAFIESLQENRVQTVTMKKLKTAINETCIEKSGKAPLSNTTSYYFSRKMKRNSVFPGIPKLNFPSRVLSCPEVPELNRLPKNLKDNLACILQLVQKYKSKCSIPEIWQEISRQFSLKMEYSIAYIHESSVEIDDVLVSKAMGLTKEDALNNASRSLIQGIMYLWEKRNKRSVKPVCHGIAIPPLCPTDSRISDQFESCVTHSSGCGSISNVTEEVPLPKSSGTNTGQISSQAVMQKSSTECVENSDPDAVEFEAVPRSLLDDLNNISHYLDKCYSKDDSASFILQQMSKKFGILLSYHLQDIKQCSLEIDGMLISKGDGLTEKSAKCMAGRLAINAMLELVPEVANTNFDFLRNPCVFDCYHELQNQSAHEAFEMNLEENNSSEIPKKKLKSSLSNLMSGETLPKENEYFSETNLDQKNTGDCTKKRQNGTVLQEFSMVHLENSSAQKVPQFNLLNAEEDCMKVLTQQSHTMSSSNSSVQKALQLSTVPKKSRCKTRQKSLEAVVQNMDASYEENCTEKMCPTENIPKCFSKERRKKREKRKNPPHIMCIKDFSTEMWDFDMLPENLKNNMGPILQFIQESCNKRSSSIRVWKKASEIFKFRVSYNSTGIKACSLEVDHVFLSKGVGWTKKDARRDACRSLIKKLIMWLSNEVEGMNPSDENLIQGVANPCTTNSSIRNKSENFVDSLSRFNAMSQGLQFLMSPKDSKKHSSQTIWNKSNAMSARNFTGEFNTLPESLKKNLTDILQYIYTSLVGQLDVLLIMKRISEKYQLQLEYHTEGPKEVVFKIDGITISKGSGQTKNIAKCVASNLAINGLIQLSATLNSDIKSCISNNSETFADKKFTPEVVEPCSVALCRTDKVLDDSACQKVPEHKVLSESLKGKAKQTATQEYHDSSLESSDVYVCMLNSLPKCFRDNCLNISQFIQESLDKQVPVLKILQDVSAKFGLKFESKSKIYLREEIPHEYSLKIDGCVVIGTGKSFTRKDAQEEANRLAIDRLIQLSSDIRKMHPKHLLNSCNSKFNNTFAKKKFVAACTDQHLMNNCKFSNLQNYTGAISEITSSFNSKSVAHDSCCQKSSDDEMKQNYSSESKVQHLMLNMPNMNSCNVSDRIVESASENFDLVKLSSIFPVLVDFSDVTKTNCIADIFSNTASFNQVRCSFRFETVSEDPQDYVLRSHLIIGEDVIGSATGKTRRTAREAACRVALSILKKTSYTIKIKLDHFVFECKSPSKAGDLSLNENNMGYKMLKTMGWAGGGLGRSDNKGIEEPIKIDTKYSFGHGLGFHEVKKPVVISEAALKEEIAGYALQKPVSILIVLPVFEKKQRLRIRRFAKKLHLHYSEIGLHSGCLSVVLSRFPSACELLSALKVDAGHTSKYEIIPPTV